MSEESVSQRAREIVRHKPAGTITYNTEDDAAPPSTRSSRNASLR
jgi:hypothetical protein